MFGGKNMPLPFPRHPGWNEFQGKHVCVQVEHAFTQLERLSPQKPPLQNAKHWSGRASRGLVLGRQETQQGCSVLRWFLEAPSVPWAGILAELLSWPRSVTYHWGHSLPHLFAGFLGTA